MLGNPGLRRESWVGERSTHLGKGWSYRDPRVGMLLPVRPPAGRQATALSTMGCEGPGSGGA